MSDADKFRQYAERIGIFRGLTPEEIALVIKHGKVLNFRQNQTIFHQGMLGSNLFIILGGEVGIYNKAELIAKCRAGDAFGEMAVLNNKPRTATARPFPSVNASPWTSVKSTKSSRAGLRSSF